MPLAITVPDEIAESIEEMSRRFGESAEHLVLAALRAHFPPVPDELAEESEALERASDDDCARLERSLQ